MSRGLAVLFCLAAALGACGGDEDDRGAAAAGPQGCTGAECFACADPFVPHPSGDGCVEVAAQSCPEGTMPVFGSTECRPVGWSGGCPAGMQADAWGCIDVQPAAACSGAQLEVLGQPECQPIGDCTAAWPPAGATIFVDDDFAPGELDATHFATIAAAVDAAPEGALIAIEAGTYLEVIDVPRTMDIAGRCAAEVIIESPAVNAPGFAVVGVEGVVVRGVTLRGHRGGVATLGGEVTLRDALVEDSVVVGVLALGGGRVTVERTRIVDTHEQAGEWGAGVSLEEAGSRVDLVDVSVVRGTTHGVTASGVDVHVSLTRTVVRDTRIGSTGAGKGLAIGNGATGSVVDSVIGPNPGANVAASGPGTHLDISGSVLRDAVLHDDGSVGSGLEVFAGAAAAVATSAMVGNAGWGVAASDAGTQLHVERSVVRGRDGAPRGLGACTFLGGALELRDTAILDARDAGIVAQDPGSHALVSGTLVRGTRLESKVDGDGYGVFVGFGGTLELTGSTLSDNDRIGLLVAGVDGGGARAEAHVTDTLVLRSVPLGAGQVFGRGAEVTSGASLIIERSAIVDNVEVGLGTGMTGSSVVANQVVVRGTRAGAAFGHGTMALGGASLTLRGSHLADNGAAGLLFSAASGAVDGVTVARNAVGIQAQDGSVLEEVGEVPEALEPLRVRVDSGTRFLSNGSRVGSGALPVPPVIGGGATSP